MTRNCAPRHNVCKGSSWSPLEVRLMEENRLKCPNDLVRIFAAHGIRRTNDAIKNQMYRLGLRGAGDADPPINYRGMDKAFCEAVRAAHPDKETGPIRSRHRDGIPTVIPRAVGPMGSGWQIDGGSGL